MVAGLSKDGQALASFINDQGPRKVGPMLSQLRNELGVQYTHAKDVLSNFFTGANGESRTS